MDDIFLSPDVTFGVTIKTQRNSNGVPTFFVEDGGPYKLRTATGREYHRIQKAYYDQSAPEAYSLLALFCSDGIPKDKIESVHPDCVWAILLEVLKRSRLTEVQAGK